MSFPSESPATHMALHRPQQHNWVLVGLALIVFSIGTAEYAVAGMLSQVASDLRTSVALTGQLVTIYAGTVMVAGPVVTALTAKYAPKCVLLASLTLFCLATMLCGISESFAMMALGRVGAGLVHGVIFATALVIAVSQVAHERVAQAIGIVTTGLTLATVIGVPIGTQIAVHTSWRWTFYLLCAIAVLGGLLLAKALPRGAGPQHTSVASQVKTLLRPAVLGTLLMTMMGYGAVFTAFTYLAPLLQQQYGPDSSTVVTMAVTAFGLGGLIGNLIASRTSDTHLKATLLTAMSGMLLSLLVLPLTIRSHGLAYSDIFLLGATAFALIPGLQVRILALAHEAPTLAAATNVAAFNLANMVGAALGGVVVSTVGLQWTGPVGAIVTAIGIIVTLAILKRDAKND